MNLHSATVRRWVVLAIIFNTTVLSAQSNADMAGAYEFEHENEFIQLNIENGRLDGYISKLGDETSDRGTPLTYFFKIAKVQGTRITFSTKQVHGLWYAFDGSVVRGSAQRREEVGYYVLQGRLTMHHIDLQKHDTQEKRSISLRSQRGNT